MESKYKIERGENYFLITGQDRIPTKITLNSPSLDMTTDGTNYIRESFGLVEGWKIINKVAHNLMGSWKPNHSRPFVPKNVRKWAIQKTMMALAKKIAIERRHLIEKADPHIVDIQKAIFAAGGKLSGQAFTTSFYEKSDKYYLEDIKKYRAAALTTFNDLAYVASNNDTFYSSCYDPEITTRVANQDWKAIYAPNNKPYTSLNKTLINLPGGLPLSVLINIRSFKLERPVYSRRELLFILYCVGHYVWPGRLTTLDLRLNRRQTISPEIMHILIHATADDITRAKLMLEAHLRQKINLRKAFEMNTVASYIMDAAPNLTHNGGLVGLMEKAIQWHRQTKWSQYAGQYQISQLTALPAIPLPTSEGVIFLDTVKSIVDESARMHHCVATYINQAVTGHCHLFHIEKDGEIATAEVSITGSLRQIKGPHNAMTNKAITHGKKVLGKWCKKLFEATVNPKNGTLIVQEDIPF